MPKLSLLPRDTRFSLLFQQGAENVVKMARELKELVCGWEDIRGRVSLIADMERDGDAITHDVMSLLHHSFITPFDREDISALAHAIDNIADLIHSTADIMYLYKIERPSDTAKAISEIILQAAQEVEQAVGGIAGRIDQEKLLKHCIEINRLENLSDDMYKRALASLFADSKDVFHVIKWREILEDMEATVDATETVADVLEGVALKYA